MRYVVRNYFPRRAVDSYRDFPIAWNQAKAIDPLRYLRGLKKLTFLGNPDKWNAHYDRQNDEIAIQDKFHKKDFLDKVQTLLHEAGHRGQMLVDRGSFDRFLSLGLNKLPYFLAMANDVHQKDYKENGIDESVRADEVYAESYSRFALGMEMPNALRKFWEERAGQNSAKDAGALPARLRQLWDANRDKIHEIFVEKDPGEPASYWLYLKPGWTCRSMGCGTIHEDTVAAVLQQFKTVHREG